MTDTELRARLEALAERWRAELAELRERYGEGVIVDEYGELWPDAMAQASHASLQRALEELEAALSG